MRPPVEGIQRAIMTIGEDQVVSYIDEDSQMIERMLQEKRLTGAPPGGAGGGDALGGAAESAADGVDPSLVASALESLIGKSSTEILPKCARGGDDFYSSEDGNDALAAGMFDLSVVCAELGAAASATDAAAVGQSVTVTGDSGVESVEPLTSDAKIGAAKNGVSMGGRPSVGKVPDKLLEHYRPRTTSKAPEPEEEKYRPRTTSKAPPPDTLDDEDTLDKLTAPSKHATSAPHLDVIKLDDTYRPRTSSKAPEPEF